MYRSDSNNNRKTLSKNANFRQLSTKLLSCFLIVLIILGQVNLQNVMALQSNGDQNKIANIDGYRVIANNQIEILTDKPPVPPDPSGAQFKILEGKDTSGRQIQITSAAVSSNTPNETMTAAIQVSGLHMAKGGGFLLTAGETFKPGNTYTVVMSNTIVGGTGFTLGHTHSNQDISFSFTYPDTLNSQNNAQSVYDSVYSKSVTPTVSFIPGNNANNVSLEGNVWFTVSVPVQNYDEVKNGLVLKRNGTTVSYAPFTTLATTTESYDCYAPVYNDDHTFFGFLLTQGSSTYYDYNWKPNSTYELSIPEIRTINGQTIPAQTLTFRTMDGDTPNKLAGDPAVSATISGNNLTVGWNAVVAGPLPINGETGNAGWPAADGYNVYVSKDPYWNFVKLNTDPISQPANSTSSTPVSYTTSTSGLEPNTTYYVRVSPLHNSYEGGMYCGRGTTLPTVVSFVTPATSVASLLVSGPSPVTIPTTSAAIHYTALVQDQYGNPMEGKTVTWSLQSPVKGVGIDSATGVVTVDNTASAGSFTVVAMDGSLTGSKTVQLTAAVSIATSIAISGPSTTMIPDNLSTWDASAPKTEKYSATVTDQFGNALSGEPVTWSLQTLVTGVTIDSATGVVTIDKTAKKGNITVIATNGSVTANQIVSLKSQNIPTSLVVSGGDFFISTPNSGTTRTSSFMATVSNQDGLYMGQDEGYVNWSLQTLVTGVSIDSATGVVTVDSTVSPGTFTVVARDENAIGSHTVIIDPLGAPEYISSVNNGFTEIALTFNKAMKIPSSASDGFTVTVDGVAVPIKSMSTSLDAHKIILTLVKPIVNGQVITVAYTAGTVVTVDGNVLATFAAQPVTNTASAQFVGATTDTTGKTVTVSFDSKMASDLPSTQRGFSITADGAPVGISAISLNADPTKIDLTLDTPITSGQTLTLSYTKGTVMAANSVLLDTFTEMNITNIVSPAAPVVKSAATSGPKHIVLKMDSALRGTIGDPLAFTVTGAASNPKVTDVQVSGMDVILTLSAAIAHGEQITVDYAKTDANNLTNGTDLANFSNQNVANTIAAAAAEPHFVSAASNLTGNVVIATFDKVMAVFSKNPAGFKVSVNGIEVPIKALAWNTDPTKIDFLLQKPIFNGQTVTLTYTPGTITADDGGLLAGFSGQAVVNNALAYGHTSTIAGSYYTGPGKYNGNDVSALDSGVNLYYPGAVAFDSLGNLFIADSSNYRVRVVAAISGFQYGIKMAAGNIYTIAGNGTQGRLGDGSIATNAQLYGAAGIAIDGLGNLYIADDFGQIRKVDTNGMITTFAGNANGTTGYSGDGGLATKALLNGLNDVAVDSTGNVYIADSKNFVIRKVDTNGKISTVAGKGTAGYSGDGGLATNAQLKSVSSIKVDDVGNIYFTDHINFIVREVAAADHTQFGIAMKEGHIYTIAGTGTFGNTGNGGPATSATLKGPRGIAIDSTGNVYISDSTSFSIKKIDSSGNISIVIGTGTKGYTAGNNPLTSTALNMVYKLAIDSTGNLYYGDRLNNIIRFAQMVDTPPTVSVTGVELDKDTMTLTVGEATGTLTATVAPTDATNKNVTWSTSDSKVATVENGVVTAVEAGTATITVTTEDGNFSKSCTVTVNPAIVLPYYRMNAFEDTSYTNGATQDGITTMTVKEGITGMKFFGVQVEKVRAHAGEESVIFVHIRNGIQQSLNVSKADFDEIHAAYSGFNVQPGDIIKAYIVDKISNAEDFNPTILQ